MNFGTEEIRNDRGETLVNFKTGEISLNVSNKDILSWLKNNDVHHIILKDHIVREKSIKSGLNSLICNPHYTAAIKDHTKPHRNYCNLTKDEQKYWRLININHDIDEDEFSIIYPKIKKLDDREVIRILLKNNAINVLKHEKWNKNIPIINHGYGTEFVLNCSEIENINYNILRNNVLFYEFIKETIAKYLNTFHNQDMKIVENKYFHILDMNECSEVVDHNWIDGSIQGNYAIGIFKHNLLETEVLIGLEKDDDTIKCISLSKKYLSPLSKNEINLIQRYCDGRIIFKDNYCHNEKPSVRPQIGGYDNVNTIKSKDCGFSILKKYDNKKYVNTLNKEFEEIFKINILNAKLKNELQDLPEKNDKIIKISEHLSFFKSLVRDEKLTKILHEIIVFGLLYQIEIPDKYQRIIDGVKEELSKEEVQNTSRIQNTFVNIKYIYETIEDYRNDKNVEEIQQHVNNLVKIHSSFTKKELELLVRLIFDYQQIYDWKTRDIKMEGYLERAVKNIDRLKNEIKQLLQCEKEIDNMVYIVDHIIGFYQYNVVNYLRF